MRGHYDDLTGRRFGRLTVIARAETRGKDIIWRCKCDCGMEKDIRGKHLKNGKTQSCGCLRHENSGNRTSREWAARQPSPRNHKGLCYNVYCPMRNNYRETVWSCSRCTTCGDRKKYRMSEGIGR